MSDRNSKGSFERRGNGGFRGGYGNRGGYSNGHRSGGYVKINQDDVPESRHSIFIRGLPSNLNTEEIMDFFDDNIGRCSIEYQKVNYERESLFVAIRFETKEDAKKAYNKYRYEDILGCHCEVTWFRDIRRYIAYQQQNGVLPRGSSGRGRGFHSNHHKQDNRKRRYSEVEDRRSRSESESDRRSRSRNSDESNSSRSRSRSVRSSSRESERRRSRSREEKKEEKKKEKKVNKSKTVRFNPQSEINNEEGRSKWERSRSNSLSDGDETPPPKKRNGQEVRPSSPRASPIRVTAPPPIPVIMESVVSSTTSTKESTESTDGKQEIFSNSSNVASEVKLKRQETSPIQNSKEELLNTADHEVEIIKESATVLNDSTPKEKPYQAPPLPPNETAISPSSSSSLEGRRVIGEEITKRCPIMMRAMRETKELQHQLISTAHLDPCHERSSEENLEKMEEREKRINNMDHIQKQKFETKRRKILTSYRKEAEIMTFAINKVVQKDPSLEEKMKTALRGLFEDKKQEMYKQFDDFLISGI